jgi:hypothetical protein
MAVVGVADGVDDDEHPAATSAAATATASDSERIRRPTSGPSLK